jgi:hypothetical protein
MLLLGVAVELWRGQPGLLWFFLRLRSLFVLGRARGLIFLGEAQVIENAGAPI